MRLSIFLSSSLLFSSAFHIVRDGLIIEGLFNFLYHILHDTGIFSGACSVWVYLMLTRLDPGYISCDKTEDEARSLQVPPRSPYSVSPPVL